MASVRGKGYDLSLSKLMQKFNPEEDLSSNKTSKTYFCSELVASAHKVLGVFPEQPASSQYWPSTFALPSADLNQNWVSKSSEASFEDLQEILF